MAFVSIKIFFRAIKRIFTGEILQQIDTEIGEGLGVVSLLLKRERSSGKKYIVLLGRASGRSDYYLFEPEEFDRFIEGADEIRASQTSAISESADEAPKLGHLSDMVLTGDVLRSVEIELYAGHLKMSVKLKRKENTEYEYVVLAATALGWMLYYPFELDEFYRFVVAAKRLRAAEEI